MIRYEQITDRLFRVSSSSDARLGFERAQALNRALADPTSFYPTIHVAGSNGKGSISTKIAKALELSGHRVGLYTSPHLFSFRERIVVNGQQIPEEAVVEGLEQIFSINETQQLNATFFELTTFLAFEYFRKVGVDVAVIETGLGGRLDATNIIHPALSVITSISREHCKVLGENIEQIAAEKAGIIKPNVPVVIGPKARCQAINDRAKELHSPLFACKKISYFYDEENTAIAALALEHLPSHLIPEPEALKQGLAIRPPCRFERIGEAILDVAHNPEAVFYLLQALHTFFPLEKFRFLVGFSKDKEYDQCLGLIADVATHIHLVQADSPRAATREELKQTLNNEDPALSTSHFSVKEGVDLAYSLALERQEMLVICGSFYIMAGAKEALQGYTAELKEAFVTPGRV